MNNYNLVPYLKVRGMNELSRRSFTKLVALSGTSMFLSPLFSSGKTSLISLIMMTLAYNCGVLAIS
jgi:hypothetical protein